MGRCAALLRQGEWQVQSWERRWRRMAWLALAMVGAGVVALGLLLEIPALAAIGAALASIGAMLAYRTFGETPVLEGVDAASSRASAAVADETPDTRCAPGLDPEVVLQVLHGASAPVGNVASAHLWLADESSGTLRLIAAVGDMMPSPEPLQLAGADVAALACEEGSATFGPVAKLHGEGLATLWRYALPIAAGEARGVAAVDFLSEDRPDISGMPAATAPLRASLSGALALHVARMDLATARALSDAASDLSRMLDPREVVRSALQRAMEISAAQTGSVMLLDSRGCLVIEEAAGLSDKVVHSTSLREGEGIAGWVLATRKPVLIEDLSARTPAARRHGVRSAVSVPIADDDGILGVLNVGSRMFPARFTQSHVDSIEVLGRQTATALRNARAISESRELFFDTLKALAVALETKDPYSRGGSERVLEYAEAIGAVFGLSGEEREALRVAALVHDIGMSAAGEGVLVSDRPLTTVERALLKMHPQIAAEILAEAPAMRAVVPIVYHHHEWYDGQGYLNGVSGETIPLGARILAVADAYVAMTSPRPYREAFTSADAMKELGQKSGTQFDPAVVDALRYVLRRGPNRVPGSSGGWD